ncbi:MAG: alcohol dehydrogenase catalytic domain-containing protein [Anaerolineae bacterium]|nr:alcohol dehydrogenase catalytic domain-containing protein [Anaerolineae bacterium]
MWAAKLYGARDMRIERVPLPPAPGPGEVLLRVTVTTICGSDLHTFINGRIGDTELLSPIVMGHEFAAVILAVGPDAFDGNHEPLRPGQRVAVDPAMPCGYCEFCRKGNPNLCLNMRFCGLWPDDGSLREYMIMPAESCFPVPDSVNDTEAALLEPLGVAIHAVDLAKLRVEESVAVVGAGPIGLLIVQMARLSGAHPIFVTERLPWRVELARRYGADVVIDIGKTDPVQAVMEATGGRGVDVAIEAAWGGDAVEQAVEMACPGGRVVLVGIPSEDVMTMRASAARRKGLTIKMSRRMKHAYPRAVRLAEQGKIDLMSLVTHRFPLAQVAEAYELNAGYRDQVVKVAVDVTSHTA